MVRYHLPGLFGYHEFYSVFLPLFKEHRDWFYEDCCIASIYGAPADCIWGGGRSGIGDERPEEVLAIVQEHGISPRLTFSNSLLREEHLKDGRCNRLCKMFSEAGNSGVIVHSELLLDYLRKNYPGFYYVSSTTKVITSFEDMEKELDREEFSYVVPDFRLNRAYEAFAGLEQRQKDKLELLCNECCWTGCRERKACYENVSRKNLGEDCPEHSCSAPGGSEGYRFSKAMASPAFIGLEQIRDIFVPMGICNFKIEGRGLGTAVILEFLLYYLTKPEHQLELREAIYLDSMLNLF